MTARARPAERQRFSRFVELRVNVQHVVYITCARRGSVVLEIDVETCYVGETLGEVARGHRDADVKVAQIVVDDHVGVVIITPEDGAVFEEGRADAAQIGLWRRISGGTWLRMVGKRTVE